ncbi:hypothetical protein PSAB_18620 [Paenibacillus sabinae T27]|uniref:Uncharacterized protein n=1 Tax=Paenibacillus sabinae T27 TaxID=1268072 RepID=X5A2M9_9BACL|nr:hypothetical protein PSAB_18620 [Paenibacillus sabinae T27]
MRISPFFIKMSEYSLNILNQAAPIVNLFSHVNSELTKRLKSGRNHMKNMDNFIFGKYFSATDFTTKAENYFSSYLYEKG